MQMRMHVTKYAKQVAYKMVEYYQSEKNDAELNLIQISNWWSQWETG
jgi:hypothetical protein